MFCFFFNWNLISYNSIFLQENLGVIVFPLTCFVHKISQYDGWWSQFTNKHTRGMFFIDHETSLVQLKCIKCQLRDYSNKLFHYLHLRTVLGACLCKSKPMIQRWDAKAILMHYSQLILLFYLQAKYSSFQQQIQPTINNICVPLQDLFLYIVSSCCHIVTFFKKSCRPHFLFTLKPLNI